MDQDSAEAQASAEEGDVAPPRLREWFGLAALALAVTMNSLDMSVVTVANPAISADLGTGLSELEWVTTAYILAFAAFLVPAGKLGDRFGHKRIFLVGIAGFALSSALVGLSTGLVSLVGWRVLQGVCGAMLMPSALAILRLTFPPDKLKVAIGVFMGIFSVAGLAGPLFGGLMVEFASWRWAFYINVFTGAIAFVIVLLAVRRDDPVSASERFDFPGVALMTVTLVALVWGITQVPVSGWTDVRPISALVVALVAGTLFVIRERSTDSPLMPLHLFGSGPVVAGVLAMFLGGGLMFGSWFFLALYFQHVRGMTPVQAGLGLLPLAGMSIVCGPLAGKLNQRYGRRVPLTIGPLAMAVGLIGLAQVTIAPSMHETSSYHLIWPFLVLIGGGISLIYPVATEVVLASVPEELAGVAGGVSETAATVGPVPGIAVLGSILQLSVYTNLGDGLAAAGVPKDVADRVTESGDAVGQGVTVIPDGTPEALVPVITEQTREAFLGGLQTSLTVAGVLVLSIVGLVWWLVKPEERVEAVAA